MLRLLLLVLVAFQVRAIPLPASKSSGQKILHDERQEGDYNIRADLKNIIIFVMPGSSTPTPSSTLDLLSLLKSNSKLKNNRSKPSRQAGSETKHFIEAKTAPYHVDIGKSDSHLLNDEILATQAPSVGAAETQNKRTEAVLRQLRSARAFVLTVPEEDFVLTKTEDNKKVVKKDGFKKKQNKRWNQEMTLLGASEQCGPEMYRDTDGVCRMKIEDRDE